MKNTSARGTIPARTCGVGLPPHHDARGGLASVWDSAQEGTEGTIHIDYETAVTARNAC